MVVVSVLLAGCMNEETKAISWDLSSSHTLEDVGWPDDRDASTQIAFEDIESVDVTFPGDLTIEAGDEVHRIWVERDDNEVVLVQIDFENQTAEDALDRAKDLADAWDIPTEPLDEWFDEIPAQEGGAEVSHNALAPGEAIDGIKPEVHVLYSFNDELPASVGLVVNWLD